MLLLKITLAAAASPSLFFLQGPTVI